MLQYVAVCCIALQCISEGLFVSCTFYYSVGGERLCDTTHPHVTNRIHTCDRMHSCVWHATSRNMANNYRAILRKRKCKLVNKMHLRCWWIAWLVCYTGIFVHVLLSWAVCVAQCVYMHDTTHSYVWHDALIRVRCDWLVDGRAGVLQGYVCSMTNPCVCDMMYSYAWHCAGW